MMRRCWSLYALYICTVVEPANAASSLAQASPTIEELRSLWRIHASGQVADEDVRRVISEVIGCASLFVRELDSYCCPWLHWLGIPWASLLTKRASAGRNGLTSWISKLLEAAANAFTSGGRRVGHARVTVMASTERRPVASGSMPGLRRRVRCTLG
jgi:hypothetical protein